MNKRSFAKITGWSLVIMTLIAGFSFGYAFQEFYNPQKLDLIGESLNLKNGLYKGMLAGILIIAILDLLVSYSLYKYFEDDHQKIALWSGILRIIYTIIFGAALYFLSLNLNYTSLQNTALISNLESFQFLWSSGLIVFGVHLFLIGYLMKLHQKIPKILWYLTLIAGVSYSLVHILKISPDMAEIADNLEMALGLPMALGELGLAIWLLVRGGK